jgi:hypothetical protein
MQGMSWIWDIKGALTVRVIVQYLQLYQRLQMVQLTLGVQDRLVWH